MSRMLQRINLPGLAFMAGLVVLWEIFARTVGARLETIPSVSKILVALHQLVSDGVLMPQLAHTVFVSIAGWLIACAIGLTAGLVIGIWRPVWTYSMASIDVLRSIPSISLISIALLLFGFSSKMEMVIVVYVSQWPVLLATASAVGATPRSYLDSARSLRLSERATVMKVRIPAALPGIVVGVRLALTLSIALAVVAEMVGNPAGLGFGIVYAQQAIQPAQAFAYLLVIGLIGWALNAALMVAVERAMKAHAVTP
ncbi:MAG: ABC transporter permease subunit [Pseudolabrys sp.]|nr:ABC transporter permease subunit [Pseudolabrys sp.]